MRTNNTKIILVFLLICFYVNLYASNDEVNHKNEYPQAIDDWISEISSNEDLMKQAIGQLFIIGTRSDWNNLYPKVMEELVRNLQPGGFIVHSYNYHHSKGTSEEQYNTSQIFHRSLILTSRDYGEIKVPPFIAADFESSGEWGSSLAGSGLIPPPSALTMSASTNASKIEELGALIGRQLEISGINMLLGPVVDVDRQSYYTNMDIIDRNWNPRKFGASPEIVVAAASNYLVGLKASNIITILKHFPGLGDYTDNLHSKDRIPQLVFDPELDLLPFDSLGKYANGIMTSHVQIRDNLVTFDSDLIHKYLKRTGVSGKGSTITKDISIGDDQTIILTDDLSDMGPILKYMKDEKKSWSDIALDAFRAGHDILLFAHLYSESSIDAPKASDLIEVRDKLSEEIKSSPILKEQFLKSLKRIILLKWNYWKNQKTTPIDFLNGDVKLQIRENEVVLKGVNYKNRNIKLSNQFLRGIHKEAFTILNDQLGKVNLRGKKISVYIPESIVHYFENFIENRQNLNLVIMREKFKNNVESKLLWREFLNDLEKKSVDYVVVLPKSVEHYHMLDYVVLKKRELLKKVIILEHSNPKNISKQVAQASTVIGTFSWHPTSFDIDKAYLSDDVIPRDPDGFPISFINVYPTTRWDKNLIIPASIVEPIIDLNSRNLGHLQSDNSILKSDNKKLRSELVNRNNYISSLKNEIEEELAVKMSLSDSKYIILAIYCAIVSLSFLSLHRQGLIVYNGDRGGIAYLYDSFITNREHLPYGIQESFSIGLIGLVGILFSLHPNSSFILAVGVILLLGPTLIGLIRIKIFKYRRTPLRTIIFPYLLSRFKNRVVMVSFILGIFMLVQMDSKDSFLTELQRLIEMANKFLQLS